LKHSPLSKEQEKLFAQYYLEGYSARYIFEKLDQPYTRYRVNDATSRMIRLRKKLGLPKRGTGFKSIRLEDPTKSILLKQRKAKRRKERIAQIPKLIANAEENIRNWKAELEKLKTSS